MPATQYDIRLLGRDELHRWHVERGHSTHRNFFSSDTWISNCPEQWGEPRLIAIGRKGSDELIGGFALSERKVAGLKQWTVHPMVPYAGYWFGDWANVSPAKFENAWSELAMEFDAFARQSCAECQLRLDPALVDTRPFKASGWQATPMFTYFTGVSAEAAAPAFESSARRQIEKARREGVTVRVDRDAKSFETRARGMMERKKLDQQYPQGFLVKLHDALHTREEGELLTAYDANGTALVSALLAWDNGTALYLYGASDDAAKGTGAPSLLQAEIIERLRKNPAIHTYDWQGANTPSVARFKKNFNPQLGNYYFLRKTYNPLLAMSRAVIEPLRNRRKSGGAEK